MKLKIGPYNENLERQIDVGRRRFVERKNAWGFVVIEVVDPSDPWFDKERHVGQYKYSYQAHAAIREACNGGDK